MTNPLTDALRRSVKYEMKQRNTIGDRLEYLRRNPHRITPYDVIDIRDENAHTDYLLAVCVRRTPWQDAARQVLGLQA